MFISTYTLYSSNVVLHPFIVHIYALFQVQVPLKVAISLPIN